MYAPYDKMMSAPLTSDKNPPERASFFTDKNTFKDNISALYVRDVPSVDQRGNPFYEIHPPNTPLRQSPLL